MWRWVLVGVAWWGGCVVQPGLIGANPYRTQVQAERRAAHGLRPIRPVVPDGVVPGPYRFRARVWADEGFRQRPRWKSYAQEWLARASDFTTAAFGATLEADIRAWNVTGGESLHAVLDQLHAQDDGADVDWVIGLVGPARAVTSDYHHLGMAEPLGKHFAVRDMNDAAEARAIEQYFSHLDDDERVELYAERKRHKELLVFLHEWAHSLGHPHEENESRVMSPGYSHQAATFSPAGAEFLRMGVVVRHGGPDAEAAAAAMRRLLASNPAEWRESERSTVDTGLSAGAPSRPAVPGSPDAQAAVYRAYQQAAANDTAGALRTLDGVRDRLTPGSDEWVNAARIYLQLGALSRADEVTAQLPGDARAKEVRDDTLRLQRSTGLAAGKSGVAPGDEPAARAAFADVWTRLAEEDVAGARRLHADMAKRFPRTLPAAVLSCCIEAAAKRVAKARAACAAALSRWDELVLAHYCAASFAPQPADGTAHLRRVLALDPTIEGAWISLGRIYTQLGDRAALLELRRGYLARFRRTLPP